MTVVRPRMNGAAVKLMLSASLAVNVTGGSAWIVLGRQTMTRAEIMKSISVAVRDAPYPWKEDRALVMSHITSPAIHEDEQQKRARIVRELESILIPLDLRLAAIHKDIDALKKEIMP